MSLVSVAARRVKSIPITASMKDEVKIFTKKQPTAKPTTEDGKRSGNRHNPSPGRIWKKGCVAKLPTGSVNATYIAATIAPYATSFVVIFNVVTSVFCFCLRVFRHLKLLLRRTF